MRKDFKEIERSSFICEFCGNVSMISADTIRKYESESNSYGFFCNACKKINHIKRQENSDLKLGHGLSWVSPILKMLLERDFITAAEYNRAYTEHEKSISKIGEPPDKEQPRKSISIVVKV